MGYQVQLRSALPIRQAVVRLQMITEKYDQMAPEKRQEFDEQTGKFLSADFNETVMVHVTYNASVQVYDRELARYLAQPDDRDAQEHHFFNRVERSEDSTYPLHGFHGRGTRIPDHLPATDQWPASDRPKDKSIKIEFRHPRVGNEGEARVLLEFKADKMMINNVVVY